MDDTREAALGGGPTGEAAPATEAGSWTLPHDREGAGPPTLMIHGPGNRRRCGARSVVFGGRTR
jgi:hypothetical protein